MPDSYRPLLLNKRCGFRKGYVPKNFNPSKLKMADMRQLSTSKCVISGKPYHVAGPSLRNRMCGFRVEYALKNVPSVKFKMADLRSLMTLRSHHTNSFAHIIIKFENKKVSLFLKIVVLCSSSCGNYYGNIILIPI